MKYLAVFALCVFYGVLSPTAVGGPDHGAAEDAKAQVDVPYLLSVCPISGAALGSMGDAIVRVYDGREVKFCCAMCIPKFEGDLKQSFKKIDQQIIESQLPFYPLTDCLVTDEPLTGADGVDEPINFVHNGRLIRLCCNMCRDDFDDDPEGFIAKLDKAVIAQQSEHYPLTTCPISGEELGSMGDAVERVYGGRLVKFCCAMCIPRFEKNPMATIEKIDAAWIAMHEDHDGHEGHDEHKGHQHGDHGG